MDINNIWSRRLKKQRWVMGACLTVCLSSGAWAISNNAYDLGIDLYNRGCYEKSLEYLTKAEIASPSDPLVHYYLASAYARLGRHKEAKQEYFACYCLDPSGQTSEYCKVALRSYGEPVPGDTLTAKSANDEQVNRAVSQIKRQAALQKQSKNDLANQGSLTAGRIGEEEASRIKSAAYRRVYSRPSYLVPGDFFNRDSEDPNAVLARAEEGARLARLSAKQKADEYEKWSKAQERAVDEIAGNLESQLKTSNVKGGAKLRAEGTGFYVRFYGQERNGPLPNTHGSVARLEPFVATPGELPVKTIDVKESVKGKVLD
jgi:tetratricopeptide (TPR) repeat protein